MGIKSRKDVRTLILLVLGDKGFTRNPKMLCGEESQEKNSPYCVRITDILVFTKKQF